ncbi:phage tailspike protein [Serratia sp. J2]|uniref:phage tailspike protein n=1 Tax=Serratia sp. J2 TaxID=3386551 RepID=UPI003917181D
MNRRGFIKSSLIATIAGSGFTYAKEIAGTQNFQQTDVYGKYLQNAKIFIGEIGKEPSLATDQIELFKIDSTGNKISVVQPLTTDNSGKLIGITDKEFLVLDHDFSVAIYDLNGKLNYKNLHVNVSEFKIKDSLRSVSSSYNDSQYASVINNPFLITGRTNIRNPRWNAPIDNASDPDAANSNVSAINMMLSSGNKSVELDDISRYVNSTVYPQDSVTISGAGRSVASIIWIGGDYPIIARPNFKDPNANGISNVRLVDLRIMDNALKRNFFYSIDITNGNSCGLERCWLDARSGDSPSDKYGVILGSSKGSNNKNIKSFVAHVKDSRLSSATLVMNTTDYYISGSELWGNNRENAVELGGGGTICGGTQIVPGSNSGIYLFNDSKYDIDTLKIIGVYFDGSSDKNLFTGWGILSADNIGLISAEIIGCDFWHLNKGGVKLDKLYSSTITSNFRDCDSDDSGESDIVISDIYSSYVYNRHFRSNSPKSNKKNLTRVNLSPPYDLRGRKGFPISSVGGQVSFSDSYLSGALINTDCFEGLGGSARTDIIYNEDPHPAPYSGKIINATGRAKFSNGVHFTDLTNDGIELSEEIDVNSLITSAKYIVTNNLSIENNIQNIAPPYLLDVIFVKEEHTIQVLRSILDCASAIRERNNGIWGEWKSKK